MLSDAKWSTLRVWICDELRKRRIEVPHIDYITWEAVRLMSRREHSLSMEQACVSAVSREEDRQRSKSHDTGAT